MIKTTTVVPPNVKTYYDKQLLSIKITIGDNLEKLHKIYFWIKKDAAKLRKYPEQYAKWKALEKEYLELYERTKAKEKNQEGKARNKTQEPFYFIRLPNKSDEYFFSRLRFKRTIAL